MNLILFTILISVILSLPVQNIRQCGPLPCFPGSIFVFRSIDLVTERQLGTRIFKFHITKNRTFTDYKGRTFSLENEINVMPVPEAISIVRVSKSVNSHLREESISIGADVSLGTWLTGSAKYDKLTRMISGGENYAAVTADNVRLYSISTNIPYQMMELSEEIINILDFLPEKYDYAFYKSIVIDYIGTHIIMSIDSGGAGIVETTIRSAYAQKYEESTIIIKLKADLKFLKVTAEYERKTKGEDKEFIENSMAHTKVEGGDVSIPLCQYNKWYGTIIDNPIKVGYKVKQIDQVIPDKIIDKNGKTHNFTAKKINIRNAIYQYLKENQKTDNFTRIENCKHLELSPNVPPRAIRELSGIPRCEGHARAFICEGPDSKGNCIAALHHHESGFQMSETIFSKKVFMSSYGRSSSIYLYGCRSKGTQATLSNGAQIGRRYDVVDEHAEIFLQSVPTKLTIQNIREPYGMGGVCDMGKGPCRIRCMTQQYQDFCESRPYGISVLMQPEKY